MCVTCNHLRLPNNVPICKRVEPSEWCDASVARVSKLLSLALWKCKNVQLGDEPIGVKTTQYWILLAASHFSVNLKLQNRTRVFITTLYPKDTLIGAASWSECVECVHLVYVAKILIWFTVTCVMPVCLEKREIQHVFAQCNKHAASQNTSFGECRRADGKPSTWA